MLNDWLNFLQASGARLSNNCIIDFGQPEAELAAALQGAIRVDLSHYGLLRIEGADSINFMQGQFTNDVRQVNAEHSQLGGHLSHKGRLFNLFRLFQRGDAYYLSMPQALLAPALERLRKYILISKVQLSEASNDLLRIGIAGSQAAEALANALGELPQNADEVRDLKDLTVIRIADAVPRFEIYGKSTDIQTLWQTLAAVTTAAGAASWALRNIQAGLPTIEPATVETFVPQMVNLQLVNGVNFRKGCYTGQEVVARMQYLGTLKRRMYRAHIDNDTPPAAGTELYSPSSDSGQGAGKVVDAQRHPGGGCDLLVVVQVALVETEAAVHIDSVEGARLQFQALPYNFPADPPEDNS